MFKNSFQVRLAWGYVGPAFSCMNVCAAVDSVRSTGWGCIYLEHAPIFACIVPIFHLAERVPKYPLQHRFQASSYLGQARCVATAGPVNTCCSAAHICQETTGQLPCTMFGPYPSFSPPPGSLVSLMHPRSVPYITCETSL